MNPALPYIPYAARQKTVSIFILLISLFSTGRTNAQRNPAIPPSAATYNNQMTAAPLLFTENKGQVADREGLPRPYLLFTAHSAGAKIFFTATGIHYQFERTVYPEGYKQDERKVKDHEKQEALRNSIKTETARFTLSLQDANPTPVIRKEAQSSYTENFYLANCAITGVHTYEKLVYENVYPGIDWIIYSKGQHLEYDFIVHPGASPELIKLKVTDAQKVSIAADGSLVMETQLGEVREAAPVSFCGNEKVATAFHEAADGTIGFTINGYNKAKDLRIDPSVIWATYYGGSTGDDYGNSCVVDGSGNVYLCGGSSSTSGIALGGFQNTSMGAGDAFLVKFNSSGTRLWATYCGGIRYDEGFGCTVDSSGNVYISGYTVSSSGIAYLGFQNTISSLYDGFLVKLNSSGYRIWGTYYGGTGYDYAYSCAVDGSGNAYLLGYTSSSTNLAYVGFQDSPGSVPDLFLVKFNSNGSRLWATYYGRNGLEQCGPKSCVVDRLGNVYLCGVTSSETNSGLASGGFQNTYSGGIDAFLVKFSSSGNRLWATYYGGSGGEARVSCATDINNNVYLMGNTTSTSDIAFNGFQNTYGGGNADNFLVKFNGNGSRLWATYYGGSGNEGTTENGCSCSIDVYGNVYLLGLTQSASGIASGGFQNTYRGNVDAYLVKFNSNGNRLWATYYGGSNYDRPTSCAVDISGNVYLAGYTTSTSDIASYGFQNTLAGGIDAFFAKISNAIVYFSIANGNWNDPAIWSGGVVPDSNSAVIINTAVTVTANASCYSLTVNPSGSIRVSAGITLTVLH